MYPTRTLQGAIFQDLANVGPPLLALVAIVEIFFLIQNPVTVLTVRYCGKFFAPPRKI